MSLSVIDDCYLNDFFEHAPYARFMLVTAAGSTIVSLFMDTIHVSDESVVKNTFKTTQILSLGYVFGSVAIMNVRNIQGVLSRVWRHTNMTNTR